MADEDDIEAGNQQGPIKRRVGRKATAFFLIFLSALLLVAWNGTVTVPVMGALSHDGPHRIVVYRRWLISPDQIVFDVWNASLDGSMADMDRLLFKSAEALKDRNIRSVVLAYRGESKFLLEGDHFRAIGETRATQNPIYLVRTLTEHIANVDGTPAFGTWTGGWLGVLSKQIDDHNALHEEWWISPSVRR